MKKLLAAIMVTLPFTLNVQANEASTALEFCKPLHSLAETIMERRQEGASMVEMLEIANSSDGGTAKSLVILMVEEAYASTRYHTHENQRRAVQDFGNDTFKLCMDVMKGDKE